MSTASYRRYVLAHLRIASARLRLHALHIDSVGEQIRNGLDLDQAMQLLAEGPEEIYTGTPLDAVEPTPPPEDRVPEQRLTREFEESIFIAEQPP